MMRKPFKVTVKEVDNVYNDFIKDHGFTDNIGDTIRKKLKINADYASNIWRMVNKLKEYDLYNEAFPDNKNERGWTQHTTRWIVDTQIPKYESEIKIIKQSHIEVLENVWKDNPLTKEEINEKIKTRIQQHTPILRAKYFDTTQVPDRHIRKPVIQHDTTQPSTNELQHITTNHDSKQSDTTQYDSRQLENDTPQHVLARGKPMSLTLRKSTT